MVKYKPKPEKTKKQHENEVNDLGRKAKDRIKHLGNVVKKDNKAVNDFSKSIRSATTVEGAKQVKEAAVQTKKAVGQEYHQQQKNLEGLLNDEDKKKNELEKYIRYSKFDYTELTKTLNDVYRNKSAHDKIDSARRLTARDIYTLNSLRGQVARSLQRTCRQGKQLGQEFRSTNLYGIDDDYMASEAKRKEMSEVDKAIKQAQKEMPKRSIDDLEGEMLPEETEKDNLSSRAKKEIGKRDAVIEELEEKLKSAGSQPSVQHVVKRTEKPKQNYGRPSVIPRDQNDVYNHKDTYD